MSRNLKEVLQDRLALHKVFLSQTPLSLTLDGRVGELEYILRLIDKNPVGKDLVKELDKYSAWDLSRNEQPYGNGVVDVIYSCRVFDGDKWTIEDYGSTPELALERTLEGE